MPNINYTDRYEAIGIQYPNRKTMCIGQCEGTGWIPIYVDLTNFNSSEDNPILAAMWHEQHDASHSFKSIVRDTWKMVWMRGLGFRASISFLWEGWSCDGWHFIKCPDCKGTGKREVIDEETCDTSGK